MIEIVEIREMFDQLKARNVERSKVFRGTKVFDELVRYGRIFESKTDDGTSVYHCRGARQLSVVKSIDKERRRVDVVMSDATVDRMRDVLDPNGWDVRNYKDNPVGLTDHIYLVDYIVSQVPKTWIETGSDARSRAATLPDLDVDFDARFMGTHQFDDPATNERAGRAFDKILSRLLRANSVGFMVNAMEKILDAEGEWTGGFLFREMELLEDSWVAVPANPSAVIPAQVNNDTSEDDQSLSRAIGDVELNIETVSITRRIGRK